MSNFMLTAVLLTLAAAGAAIWMGQRRRARGAPTPRWARDGTLILAGWYGASLPHDLVRLVAAAPEIGTLWVDVVLSAAMVVVLGFAAHHLRVKQEAEARRA